MAIVYELQTSCVRSYHSANCTIATYHLNCFIANFRVLPVPEIRGSNPVIGKFYLLSNVLYNCIENTKITRKRPVMVH